jgi:hypothetical protein
MMTSSVFYVELLHVRLTSSTSKDFVDHYGFMGQIMKLIKLIKNFLHMPLACRGTTLLTAQCIWYGTTTHDGRCTGEQ